MPAHAQDWAEKSVLLGEIISVKNFSFIFFYKFMACHAKLLSLVMDCLEDSPNPKGLP